MSRDLLDLVRELNTLNDDNLADRVIANSDVQWCLSELQDILEEMPTLTQPNEPLTWEELKAETKINPVYSMKYGWIFPSIVKDEPYKQVWFFTSKGFANTELFHRDTFYRRPPEGEV